MKAKFCWCSSFTWIKILYCLVFLSHYCVSFVIWYDTSVTEKFPIHFWLYLSVTILTVFTTLLFWKRKQLVYPLLFINVSFVLSRVNSYCKCYYIINILVQALIFGLIVACIVTRSLNFKHYRDRNKRRWNFDEVMQRETIIFSAEVVASTLSGCCIFLVSYLIFRIQRIQK